jgi:hypothetical protein
VYWVNVVYERPDGPVVIQNITEGAKREVEQVTEPIERDLLYPLLRGRDVQRWQAEPSAWIIVPHTAISRMHPIDPRAMQSRYPRTYSYLKLFEIPLGQRGGFTGWERQFVEEGFYTIQRVGTYTFAPWKIVWREQARLLTASVIGPRNGKPVIPDHKLMMVDCETSDEAHYLCALMNSMISQFLVMSYSVETQTGLHVLERLNIPRYSQSSATHVRLSGLSRRAHEASRRGEAVELLKVEGEIAQQAAELWALTANELKQLEASFQELLI